MYYEKLFGTGLEKRAGDDDTLKGNAISALVPFGTVNKVRDRGEGVLGYIVRHLMQSAGSVSGAAAGGLPFIGRGEAAMTGKNKVLDALQLLTMLAGSGAGSIAGDRAADRIL